MVRKLVCAAFMMTVAVGVVVAEETTGIITDVKGNSFKFQKTVKGKKEGDQVSMTLAKDGKVVKGTFNKDTKKLEAGEAVEGGLSNKMFTEAGEKGVAARVTHEGANASQIIVFGGKKKKDGK